MNRKRKNVFLGVLNALCGFGLFIFDIKIIWGKTITLLKIILPSIILLICFGCVQTGHHNVPGKIGEYYR